MIVWMEPPSQKQSCIIHDFNCLIWLENCVAKAATHDNTSDLQALEKESKAKMGEVLPTTKVKLMDKTDTASILTPATNTTTQSINKLIGKTVKIIASYRKEHIWEKAGTVVGKTLSVYLVEIPGLYLEEYVSSLVDVTVSFDAAQMGLSSTGPSSLGIRIICCMKSKKSKTKTKSNPKIM